MASLYGELTAILRTDLRVPEAAIRPEATFDELDLDSLALVELITAMEERTGLEIGEALIGPHFTLERSVQALEDLGPRS